MSFETIKNSALFGTVFRQAKSWHTPAFVCFFLPSSDKLVGFVASKKVGNAVERNRAKRLLREIFREQRDLREGRYIIVAKKPLLETPFVQLSTMFDKTIKHLTNNKNLKAQSWKN